MSKTIKIAISLPEDLLEAAERERIARGESRSEFFRQALQNLLRQKRERDAIERYVAGYREQPETDEEVQAAYASSQAALAQEPWE